MTASGAVTVTAKLLVSSVSVFVSRVCYRGVAVIVSEPVPADTVQVYSVTAGAKAGMSELIDSDTKSALVPSMSSKPYEP